MIRRTLAEKNCSGEWLVPHSLLAILALCIHFVAFSLEKNFHPIANDLMVIS